MKKHKTEEAQMIKQNIIIGLVILAEFSTIFGLLVWYINSL